MRSPLWDSSPTRTSLSPTLSKTFSQVRSILLIFAAPKLPTNTQADFLKKKTYGKVPVFLQKIKREIEDEYQLVREMQIEEENEKDRAK